jgi:hypothetical protein
MPSPRHHHLLAAALLAAALLAVSCSSSSSPAPAGSSSAAPGASAPLAPADAGSDAAPVADADAGSDAGAPADAGSDAGPADAGAPVVADNKVDPTEGPELQDRAKALFEAIVKDDPSLAEPFWFPREPFIPLKDVKDPGKYWNELHRAYEGDVHALHGKRKSWEGASFVSFEGWSRPKWVAPGKEANKIGYYRAMRGKIRYTAGGKKGDIEVHTIITWQGRWYVTHLRKIRH